MLRPRPLLLAVPVAAVLATALSAPVLACGALVAPNGAVRLSQTTTLVSWHQGTERYLTSFAFQGRPDRVGWIVPLPAVPIAISEGGAWTLQRLEREFHPDFVALGAGAPLPDAADRAVVVERAQVGALGIRVIKGSGGQILAWCHANGFDVAGEISHHLLRYAAGSPYFMAARYDLALARRHHLGSGDGTPVLMTFHVAHLWVPLEVLADDDQPVRADIFLLTDSPLTVSTALGSAPLAVGAGLPGAPGLVLAAAEPMNPALHHDLASDRHMDWVPDHARVSYLTLRALGSSVDYDLALGAQEQVRVVPFGTPPSRAATVSRVLPDPAGSSAELAPAAMLLLVAGLLTWVLWPRRRPTS
ncbi:MAG: DUF2330 domain-containing protein [Candidatus Dormibacteria bacterium]